MALNVLSLLELIQTTELRAESIDIFGQFT